MPSPFILSFSQLLAAADDAASHLVGGMSPLAILVAIVGLGMSFAAFVGSIFGVGRLLFRTEVHVESNAKAIEALDKKAEKASERQAQLFNEAIDNVIIRIDRVERKAEGTHDEVTGPQSRATIRLEGSIALLNEQFSKTATRESVSLVMQKVEGIAVAIARIEADQQKRGSR